MVTTKPLAKEKLRWHLEKTTKEIPVHAAAFLCQAVILIVAGLVMYRIVSMLIGLDGCGEI